ncbi:hypothetical protein HG530_003394 [Fusarium avenaceum]|nr:hypothetical protein HG530_003394 [Fusarium avenaceum]
MYYLEEPTSHWPSAALHTVKHISDNMPPGDILLFVPTVKYVEQLCVLLNEELSDKVQALPLYAELAYAQQQKAMSRNTGPLRKCVVSTNVAETSLTIQGLVYVIDNGIETASGYNPRGNMETLISSDISQDSARQRAGRAGTCFRLYTKKTHDEDFVPITPAEIQSSSITQEVLQAMAMNSDATHFDFVIPPDTEVFFRALTDLTSLWIREYIVKSTGAITPKGRNAACLPAHPMWWNVIIEGEKLGCGSDVTTLAAIASVSKPIFLRPWSVRYAADQAKKQFSCPISDHAAQLNALHAYARTQFQGVIDMDQWSFDTFIDRKVMEEIIDVRKQLIDVVESLLGKKLSIGLFDDQYETNIGKALARGLPHKIAIHKSDDVYVTINDNVPVMLSADSGMVGMKHKWVVFNDVIYVGSCYLGTATAVKPEWFADLPFFQDDRLAIRGDGTPRQPQVKEALQSINSPSSLFPPSMVASTPDGPAPLSTSDAARAFLASRKVSAFPQSWRFNMENPDTAPAAYTSYRNDLFDAYTEAGVLSRGFVKDLDGKQVLRSTSLPSPTPKNNSLVRPWSWVQKDDGSARVFQKVALESIPLYEAADKDQRSRMKHRDMFSMDAPWEDTRRIFASAIDIYKAMTGNDWQPGMLVFRDPETRSTMSQSSDFIRPSEVPVSESSATFRAHTLIYPTPSGVGCGWGDFSHFRPWQLYGRLIKPSMVPDKTWSSSSQSLVFVEDAKDAPGGGKKITVNVEHKAFQIGHGEGIQSLRDRLVKKKSYELAPRSTRYQRRVQGQSVQNKSSQPSRSTPDW